MLKIVGCLVTEHDPRLVAISALICALGCFTTATLIARAGQGSHVGKYRGLVQASAVFGGSVWSLHFVAMLAFTPANMAAYNLSDTAFSAVLAAAGALLGLLVWNSRVPRPVRVGLGGILLGIGVAGMHYLGVDAMRFSGFVALDPGYVAASVLVSIVFSIVALARARQLNSPLRRVEAAAWLSLAVCGLHFTGMAAMTVTPGMPRPAGSAMMGSHTLAIAVGGVSLVILVASLAATTFQERMSQRSLQDISRMRLMSNLAREAVLIHRGGVVLEVNIAGERMFKATAEGLIGRPVLSLFTDDSLPAVMRREQCPPGDRLPEEMQCQAMDGSTMVVELSCQPIDYLGGPATAVALRDLTDRRRDEARIRHLARHDALTGLSNRYTLLERLDSALDSAAQHRGSLAVVYIDLDRFKPVNDLHGHAAGDTLLVQVAKRITAEIQPGDTLARIGGDEFVMLLSADPSLERVSGLTGRVIDAIRKPFDIEGQSVEIGASAGIALYPQDGAIADTLMRAADAAMYRAKEDGRGTLRFYEASMNAQHRARLQLERELGDALRRDELVLHYQPMVNGATGELETFEALIRWNHPERGLVGPMEFIPLAEQTGLIDGIGRWVIETACREAASWPHPWRVSVNVSPRQFKHSDVCSSLGAALRANALDPARLVVEVTEGVLIDDAAAAVNTLNRMRAMGVRIALDDFGTGYSSLSYLQLFRFDKFKIDKSFVSRLGHSDDALTIIRTIVNLGHNLGLHVTAEGVETEAQLALLQTLGCNQIQGYLVARPGPVSSFGEHERACVAALFEQDRIRLSA